MSRYPFSKTWQLCNFRSPNNGKAYSEVVSCPDPPSGGCGEREKEGLGNNPGWKCPERRNSATGVD